MGHAENIELTPEQARLLMEQLRKMRHDVNNHLAVILASAELMRQRPEMTEKLLQTLANKPASITASIKDFSAEMEKLLQVPKPQPAAGP